MAKIDDIKSKSPDSRMNSLATSFRPGAKRRIPLPTSIQEEIGDEEKRPFTDEFKRKEDTESIKTKEHELADNRNELTDISLQITTIDPKADTNAGANSSLTTRPQLNASESPTLNSIAPPTSDIPKIEFNENFGIPPQPNTTEHNNQTQLNTTIEAKIPANQTQLNTINDSITKHKLADSNYSKISILHGLPNTTEHNDSSNESGKPNTTEHNSRSVGRTKNQTQLNTETKHIQKIKNVGESLTKHNSTQLNTNEFANQTQLNTTLNTTKHTNQTQLNTGGEVLYTRYLKQNGNKVRVLTFLYDEGIRQNSRVVRLSYPMLANVTGVKEVSIKTTVARLKEDGLIEVDSPGGGTGAIITFTLKDSIVSSLVIEKLKTQPNTTEHNNQTQLNTTLNTTAPSKLDSIININSNLTSDLNSKPNSTNWFGQLNFSNVPVQPSQVNPSIRQLVLQKLTREDVQNFIDRFTSWAATQNRINKPVGMFCEKLKAYAVDGDSDVLLAMTEQDRRQEAEFSAQIEKARQEMELIEKARRHEIEKNASEQFESWYETANDEEIQIVLKPSSLMPFRSEIYKRSLRQVYFEKHNL